MGCGGGAESNEAIRLIEMNREILLCILYSKY